MWTLIEQAPAGFPWLAIAGKTLTGWLVIDMDATLVTARSDKERAASTWKKGYGLLTELQGIAAGQEAERSRKQAIMLSGMSQFAGVGHWGRSPATAESGHRVMKRSLTSPRFCSSGIRHSGTLSVVRTG